MSEPPDVQRCVMRENRIKRYGRVIIIGLVLTYVPWVSLWLPAMIYK